MSPTSTTAPAPLGKRTKLALFAPLVILVAAALVTNFGGGLAKDAHAVNVNVSAGIVSNLHLTSTCGTASPGDGSINLGAALAANTFASGTCDILYGNTNGTSTMKLTANASNLGVTGAGNAGAACTAVTAASGNIGVRVETPVTTATKAGTYTCLTNTYVTAPTSATTFCGPDVASGTDYHCNIGVGLGTGSLAVGAYSSGTLTQTLS